ncbi:MAG: ATP-binding protein [Aggregatilineaceae bacterium]
MGFDTSDLNRHCPAAMSREEQVDRLNDQAWALLHSDPRRSQSLATEAGRLANTGEVPYQYGLAYSLLIRSILAWDQSQYQEALELALQAARLFDVLGERGKQAYTVNHIAGIHYFLGNSSLALELGYRAQRLAEMSGDPALIASVLNDTGYMLLHLGDRQEALAQLERSLAMHRQLDYKHGQAQALDSIGKAYFLLGDFEKALAYEQQSLALDRQIGYPRAEAEALGNIGKIYRAAGDLEQALHYFEQSLVLSKERGYRQFEAATLLDIGYLLLDQGKAGQALLALEQACEVAEAIGSKPVLAEIHAALAAAYEQSSHLRESLKYYKMFHALFHDASQEIISFRIHSLEATYETEKARQEAEIYRLKNVALQQEIEEREKLIAELDAFAHTVAHDLKNPLAVIIGSSELMTEQLRELGDEEMARLGEDQLRMAFKIVRIVDELLLLASIRRESVILSALQMGTIVAEAKTRLVREIEGTGAEINGPEHWPVALGYAPWVEEVWANYLSNAIKYGGTPPRIELGATREGDMIRFWVRDNGAGIPPNEREHLFTEFGRTSSRGSGGGHGLGLSIVKRIVEKLGGSVAVENAPGQGSTFSFTLPAHRGGDGNRSGQE